MADHTIIWTKDYQKSEKPKCDILSIFNAPPLYRQTTDTSTMYGGNCKNTVNPPTGPNQQP